MHYIELDGNKLYIPSSVSKTKGKIGSDYSANWSYLKGGANLDGKEYIFLLGSEEHKKVRDLVGEKYGLIARPAANSNIKLIDEERAMDYLNTPTPNCKITGIPHGKKSIETIIEDEPCIDSREVAIRLSITHEAVMKLINTYKDLFTKKGKGHLRFEIGTVTNSVGAVNNVKYVMLNEEQLYFLGTLCKNTQAVVDFKDWLTSTFTALRNIKLYEYESILKSYSGLPSNEEGLIQTQLVLLSSYTDTPLRQEVVLEGTKKRIDLLLSGRIAIELKTKVITPSYIKTLLFEKSYYYLLREQYPDFETLILCSTQGISDEAMDMLTHTSPYMVYQSIPQLVEILLGNSDTPRDSLVSKFPQLVEAKRGVMPLQVWFN